MLVVLDTNILISALLSREGAPALIRRTWRLRLFTLVTSTEQMQELRATLRRPHLAHRIKPYDAGRLVNEIKHLARFSERRASVQRSPDPTDDFLLEICEGAEADYLVTGDKAGLLALKRHGRTKIVSARQFAEICVRTFGEVGER